MIMQELILGWGIGTPGLAIDSPRFLPKALRNGKV